MNGPDHYREAERLINRAGMSMHLRPGRAVDREPDTRSYTEGWRAAKADSRKLLDLADAHVAALKQLIAAPTESFTFNCGYGRGFSVLEVLDAVDRVTNMTIERRIEGRRAGDPAELVADNSAILAALDWQPKRAELDGIVRDALAWERKLAEMGK